MFCEKDAIAGVLAPVTSEYDVRLSPVRGYCSDSFAYEIGSHWAQIEKPIHAYYLGDYDPSGFDIERDLREKLFKHALRNETDADTKLSYVSWTRLAINESDFDEFGLIELSVKKSDRRYRKFIENHGERCAEVDALPPQELRRRLEESIAQHIPTEEWQRLKRVEELEQQSFTDALETVA